jgi:predicted Zn-dependent peptidase
MEFRKRTLDNGLTIVAECNEEAHSAALGFFVNTGSRDEHDAISGVSHFLEHMVFKGTGSRSAEDVNREFDEMGAHYNAFTSEENTVYYAAVLPECQERAVSLLADLIRPALRKEDFDTEKQVIIEEIKMYEDQPPFGADEKAKAAFFGPHPLSRSVLGTAESITALEVEQMREYLERRYSPGNITLAAAGQIDFDRLTADAERLSRSWKPAPAKREEPAFKPVESFLVLPRPSATQEYVLQFAPGPKAADADRYAAKLLGVIVGDEQGSRLFWELVDPGHAEQVSLGHHDYQGAGIFSAYMSCEPEQTADNLQRMLDVYRKVEAEGVTEPELERAKSKVNSRVVLSSERPRSRLFAVGANWMQRGEYRSVSDDLKAVAKLTVPELNAVLKRYPLSVNTTVAVGPLAEVGRPK